MNDTHSRASYSTYSERCAALVKASYDRAIQRHPQTTPKRPSGRRRTPAPAAPAAAALEQALSLLDSVCDDMTSGPASAEIQYWTSGLALARERINQAATAYHLVAANLYPPKLP